MSNEAGHFCKTVRWLGRDRESKALLRTLDGIADPDLARFFPERILRLAFDDQRTGLSEISYSVGTGDSQPDTGFQPNFMFRMILRMVFRLILWKLFPF